MSEKVELYTRKRLKEFSDWSRVELIKINIGEVTTIHYSTWYEDIQQRKELIGMPSFIAMSEYDAKQLYLLLKDHYENKHRE